MEYIKRLRRALRDPGRKKQVYVFLMCLFCSAVFWLFSKLSREAQAGFEQPVLIGNVPSDVVISEQSHQVVQYTLQATGARMLALRFLVPADTLVIDARTLGRTTRGGELWHFASASQLRSALAARLDGARNLVTVWPDTIFVKLAFASERKVPVKLKASYTFERRFGQYGPVRLMPDSVLVRGPRQIVDTLKAVETEPLIFENLSQSVQQMVALVNPGFNVGLTMAPKEVEMVIPVEEFTEASVELVLQVACNHHDGVQHRNIRLFPNRVSVTCLVALKDYARVDASLFSAYVPCPFDSPPETNRLEVFVETFPDFVTIQSVRPATVEFLIMQ